jgi:ankyrin repeat protein
VTSRKRISKVQRDLSEAISKNDLSTIRAIVGKADDAHALLNDPDFPAVHMVCFWRFDAKELKTLQTLIELGADITLTDRDGDTKLHHFFSTAHNKPFARPKAIETVSELQPFLELFKKAGIDFNARDKDLNPPIFAYAGMLTPKNMEMLQQYGVRLDLANKEGTTLAHLFAKWGKLDCLQYLIDQKVPINVVDRQDNTLLHAHVKVPVLVKFTDFNDMVALLNGAGVNLNARNKDEKTAADLLRDKSVQGLNLGRIVNNISEGGARLSDADKTYSAAHKLQAAIDMVQPPAHERPALQIACGEIERIAQLGREVRGLKP